MRCVRAEFPSTSPLSLTQWSVSARRRGRLGPDQARRRRKRSGSRCAIKSGATEFLGYETESAEGVVAALVKDGKEVPELKKGESGTVVMNQTPFYGESGGQVGDTGEMRREGVRLIVSDTQKKAGDLFVHVVKVERGSIKVGDPLLLDVDHARRSAIRQNHSATHLLHEALRQVLGDHVAQKGSLVAPDRLRFDFSHPKPMSAEEIERVEDIANDIVLQNAPVTTRLMAVDDAIASGARALFGEKYGDEVRVVAMGEGTGNTMGWSVELCGGTHVRQTGDIGLVSLVGESGVAAGVRRIEALTGKSARKTANKQLQVVKAAAAELKVPLEDMPARIGTLLDERKKLERDLSEAKKKLAMGGGEKAEAIRRCATGQRRQAAGAGGIRHRAQGSSQPRRRGQAAGRSGVVAIVATAADGKAGIVVGVTDDLTKRFNAVELVKKGAESFRTSDYRAMISEASPACHSLRTVIYLGTSDWTTLLAQARTVEPAELAAHEAALSFDDPINIQYTSGTTGSPRSGALSAPATC